MWEPTRDTTIHPQSLVIYRQRHEHYQLPLPSLPIYPILPFRILSLSLSLRFYEFRTTTLDTKHLRSMPSPSLFFSCAQLYIRDSIDIVKPRSPFK